MILLIAKLRHTMYIIPNLAFVASFLIPYKKLDFFKSYLEAVRLIDTYRRDGVLSDAAEAELHRTITRRIRLAHLVVFMSCSKFFLHWLFPTQDVQTAILLVDVPSMAGLDSSLQLVAIGFLLLLHIPCGGRLFVHYHPFFTTHYYDTLVLDKMSNIFLRPYRCRGRDILMQLKTHVFYALNLIMAFSLFVHMIMLYIQLLVFQTIWQWKGETYVEQVLGTSGPVLHLFSFPLTLVFAELCFVCVAFWAYYLVYIGSLLLSITTLVISWTYAMFVQISEHSVRLRISTIRLAPRLQAILVHRRRSIVFFIKLTTYYSNLFLTWMVYNVPLSCYLCCLLIFGRVRPDWIPLIVVFLVQQWMVIFGVHVLGMRVNFGIIQPNPPLLHLAAVQRRLPLRTTLRLSLSLQAFHTRKRYGFRYGHVGVITMLTFAKSLVLYSEFIMYVCKIVAEQ